MDTGPDDMCYHLSDIRANCTTSINTEIECKIAADSLNATFTKCEDMQGCAQVKGCFSDSTSKDLRHRFYWKAEGQFVSNDPKIRKVCRGREETTEKQERGCKQP